MHRGVRRAVEQRGGEFFQRVSRSRGPYFHRAIREISDRPPEAQALSLPHRPPSVSHSLDSAVDTIVDSWLTRLVQGGHLLMFATGYDDQPGMQGKGRATG